MRLIRYNVATTLDGFIASADHTTPWIIEDPTIDFPALYVQFSTFIMGRKTYETMLSFGTDNPLKDMSRESLIIISRSMKQDDHRNITIINNDVVDHVKRLKNAEGKDIWVMGGSELVGTLLGAGLVDRIEAAVMPVVIGEGVKMVTPHKENTNAKGWTLNLEKVETKESGILMTEYGVIY